jgi:hypothetical protein
MSTVVPIFAATVAAILENRLITRSGRDDKEFHFQNWFKGRLDELALRYDIPGRNSYPDVLMVASPEGYELKGLAYPGREASYDANSQVPRGEHNGRHVFYVFGRYPKDPDGNSYPVLDLVICHGSFLNADNHYVHKNRSFRGFGSYGDILVRDRKMYVAPTPYALAEGTAHHRTLIVPEGFAVDRQFVHVGDLVRREVDEVTVAYRFNLQRNELSSEMVANPNAGREHRFNAYRLPGEPTTSVKMRSREKIMEELAAIDDET